MGCLEGGGRSKEAKSCAIKKCEMSCDEVFEFCRRKGEDVAHMRSIFEGDFDPKAGSGGPFYLHFYRVFLFFLVLSEILKTRHEFWLELAKARKHCKNAGKRGSGNELVISGLAKNGQRRFPEGGQTL